MADKLHFDLVSPERRVFAGEVDMVVVPGSEGDFGVLANHAPFMSTIRTGAISVHSGNDVSRTFIRGGFAEVTAAGLTILAEEAIDLADVNAEDVSKSLAEAREDLGQARDDEERHEAEARIEKFQALLSELSH
ncbi:ATP synthase F1, epsilon subunit [Oceanicaulis sp. HTCC2633]|uniref:F0F1 ATP synthase subunit epsilon n=1 Tax=Oceanicaulis sp. HTCC2633 TaxID=314254 RepID=UPI00006697A3|nr:F0F1 ATP synthase subunit epsilon [Oceanicaulis sp. HTCC2633]EAP89392.1 ATP synthase F1, epsilon subunit [Oceanicaulis sp. HTCC2633]